MEKQLDICKRSLAYFKADWLLIVSFILLIVLSIAIGLLQAWPMAILIDAVFTNSPKREFIHKLFLYFLPNNMLGQALGIALIGMVLQVIQNLISGAKCLLANRINNFAMMRLRNELYDKAKNTDKGEAFYRVCNDAYGICQIFNVILNMGVSFCTLFFMVYIMVKSSLALTLIGLSVAPILYFINKRFADKICKVTSDAKSSEAKMIDSIFKDSKSVYEVLTRGTALKWLDLNWEQEKYWFCIRTVFSVGGAIIFASSCYFIWRDQFYHPIVNGMTLGLLSVFMDYLGKLWGPLTSLTSINADLQPAIAGAKRSFELLDG